MRSRWYRDRLGRPVKQETLTGGDFRQRSRTYQWSVNDRLQQIDDSQRGLTRFGHDDFGNLAWSENPDGSMLFRMPDAVGNLFRTQDRKDRKYGRAGQLLQSGSTRYKYDAEGNLIRKILEGGKEWRYEWDAAGILRRVTRPDGETVTFTYDALGRRLSKTYRGKITRWVWDGNIPLHEWVEQANMKATAKQKALEAGANGGHHSEDLVTWLFEPEAFAPLAKLTNQAAYDIISDHLGTPVSMHAPTGETMWSADLNGYGEVLNLRGKAEDCPFRYPGQYEDVETGLHYNRFRYYDPREGIYVSQDPIGLSGGMTLYSYVNDPLTYIDKFGLSGQGCREGKYQTLWRGERSSMIPEKVFKEGLKPKGIHSDLLLHTTSNTTAGNFVSATASKEIATNFAVKNGYIYEIRTNRGIDVNQALGKKSPFPEQLEQAIPGGVQPNEIVGAHVIKGGRPIGEFILNSNYIPK